MRKLVILITLCVFMGACLGCASSRGPNFSAKYYPECYDPVEQLCKTPDKYDSTNYRSEVKGAFTGALLGAISGAIVGGITGGSWSRAAIGAAAGAAAGTVTGAFAAWLNKAPNQQARLTGYNNILDEKSSRWMLEQDTATNAYNCYQKQLDLLASQWSSGQISQAVLIGRYQEIQSGLSAVTEWWNDETKEMREILADGELYLDEQYKKAVSANATPAELQQLKQAREMSVSRANEIMADNEKVDALRDQVMKSLQNFRSGHNLTVQLDRFVFA